MDVVVASLSCRPMARLLRIISPLPLRRYQQRCVMFIVYDDAPAVHEVAPVKCTRQSVLGLARLAQVPFKRRWRDLSGLLLLQDGVLHLRPSCYKSFRGDCGKLVRQAPLPQSVLQRLPIGDEVVEVQRQLLVWPLFVPQSMNQLARAVHHEDAAINTVVLPGHGGCHQGGRVQSCCELSCNRVVVSLSIVLDGS